VGQDHTVTPPEITEDGLLLRAWRPEDADAVYQACQDPEIPRWTTVPAPYLLEHAVTWLTVGAPAAWQNGTAAPLGVFDAATGELLGANGLVSIDLSGRTGEIGFWVAAWARGRGVATTATRAVVRWAFEALDLNRIVWRAALGNHLSRLVATRVGFRPEGIARRVLRGRDGAEADAWVAALLRGEVRRPDAPLSAGEKIEQTQAYVFLGAQPKLQATTPGGAPVGLRRLEQADIPRLIEAFTDPECVRWASTSPSFDQTEALAVIDNGRHRWLRGAGAQYCIVDADDRLCGTTALRLDSTNPSRADIGYLTAADVRGRGVTTAAVAALCRWGFEALALQRIEWRSHVGNVASRRVAEKVGFVFEGTLRRANEEHDQFLDCWVASLVPGDLGGAVAPVPG
jgi:RimJ/RimL family protein N-acetyltransferase